MKKFNCSKCNSTEVFIEQNGNNIGLYCADCGKWIKWLNKDELRLAERQINSHEQEIRAKAIDEFAENLKRKILEEIYDVSDRQKNYEVGSDMSMTCSHIMGTLRDVYHRIVDEIAEQMKGRWY